MKIYEIWTEGYIATGENQKAFKLGEGKGNTFDEAVGDYMDNNIDHNIELNERNKYISEKYYKNRNSNWNIWGCNLYDNEIDARESFG